MDYIINFVFIKGQMRNTCYIKQSVLFCSKILYLDFDPRYYGFCRKTFFKFWDSIIIIFDTLLLFNF